MSTRLRPTRMPTGRYHATIRVAFTPCLQDVIAILAAKGDPATERPVSYIALHELLTACFYERGNDALANLRAGFVDAEWTARLAWAAVQVKRLYPTWHDRDGEGGVNDG